MGEKSSHRDDLILSIEDAQASSDRITDALQALRTIADFEGDGLSGVASQVLMQKLIVDAAKATRDLTEELGIALKCVAGTADA